MVRLIGVGVSAVLIALVSGCSASSRAAANARAVDGAGASKTTTTSAKASRDLKARCAGAPLVEVRLGARDDQASAPKASLRAGALAGPNARVLAKSTALGMADLAVLDRKGAWEEILERADEVTPALRSAAWEPLVERAAVELLRRYADTGAFDAIFGTQIATKRYPHLAASRLVTDARSSAIRVAVDTCLEDPRRGRRCVESAKDWLRTPGTAPETTFEVAKIVSHKQSAYVAASLFKAALDQRRAGGASAGTFCVDPDLRTATAAALALPDEYDEAGAARAIAAGPCWDAMKDGVRATLEESDAPYFRDNACAVLRVKGAF